MSLQLMAGLLKFGAGMAAGQRALERKELEAYNIGTEKVMGEAEAVQRSNDRLEAYRLNTKANLAAFSATGRDIDSPTVRAFLDKQKEIAAEDVSRSDLMAMFEGMKLSQEQAATIAEGKALKRSATIQAYTGLAGTLQDYKDSGGKLFAMK